MRLSVHNLVFSGTHKQASISNKLCDMWRIIKCERPFVWFERCHLKRRVHIRPFFFLYCVLVRRWEKKIQWKGFVCWGPSVRYEQELATDTPVYPYKPQQNAAIVSYKEKARKEGRRACVWLLITVMGLRRSLDGVCCVCFISCKAENDQ